MLSPDSNVANISAFDTSNVSPLVAQEQVSWKAYIATQYDFDMSPLVALLPQDG